MGAQKRIAIIGASEFQNPLIVAAKERGLETHVFAWESEDIGETTADFFYPISVTEIDAITSKCRELHVDGIASIGSDLANITVAAVAQTLGLTANSMECVANSTSKARMRTVFLEHSDPSPRFILLKANDSLPTIDFEYPIIVKPSDRSGSRGITKLVDNAGLKDAVNRARSESFSGDVLIEEFVEGDEYSVEYISWQGKHRFLAVTEKFTNGSPSYIETGHLEPARIDQTIESVICNVVEHALTSLGIEYGASHSEVKVSKDGSITIIEIGSRMGGDCIGSHLVHLSTGYDFINAVIDVALGIEPLYPFAEKKKAAAVRFVFTPEDIATIASIRDNSAVEIALQTDYLNDDSPITDSSSRHGFCVFSSTHLKILEPYLPEKK